MALSTQPDPAESLAEIKIRMAYRKGGKQWPVDDDDADFRVGAAIAEYHRQLVNLLPDLVCNAFDGRGGVDSTIAAGLLAERNILQAEVAALKGRLRETHAAVAELAKRLQP